MTHGNLQVRSASVPGCIYSIRAVVSSFAVVRLMYRAHSARLLTLPVVTARV